MELVFNISFLLLLGVGGIYLYRLASRVEDFSIATKQNNINIGVEFKKITDELDLKLHKVSSEILSNISRSNELLHSDLFSKVDSLQPKFDLMLDKVKSELSTEIKHIPNDDSRILDELKALNSLSNKIDIVSSRIDILSTKIHNAKDSNKIYNNRPYDNNKTYAEPIQQEVKKIPPSPLIYEMELNPQTKDIIYKISEVTDLNKIKENEAVCFLFDKNESDLRLAVIMKSVRRGPLLFGPDGKDYIATRFWSTEYPNFWVYRER